MKHLSALGIAVSIGLIWYGRRTASDLRIIGYIMLAPALFGAYKSFGGPALALSKKALAAGAPSNGASLPTRKAVARAGTRASVSTTGSGPPAIGGTPRSGSSANGSGTRPPAKKFGKVSS